MGKLYKTDVSQLFLSAEKVFHFVTERKELLLQKKKLAGKKIEQATGSGRQI